MSLIWSCTRLIKKTLSSHTQSFILRTKRSPLNTLYSIPDLFSTKRDPSLKFQTKRRFANSREVTVSLTGFLNTELFNSSYETYIYQRKSSIKIYQFPSQYIQVPSLLPLDKKPMLLFPLYLLALLFLSFLPSSPYSLSGKPLSQPL